MVDKGLVYKILGLGNVYEGQVDNKREGIIMIKLLHGYYNTALHVHSTKQHWISVN